MILASINGYIEVVKYLVAMGGNIEAKNLYTLRNIIFSNGETPLMSASRYGNSNIVRYLLKMLAKIDEENYHISNNARNYKLNSLIIASENGHIDVVKYLLDKGAKVESTDDLNFNIFN